MTGGALGALSRYAIGQWMASFRFLSMPVGTFAVNLLGCLLLGLLTGLAERYTQLPRPLVLMLTVGFCGSFTTFSTFTGETLRAFEAGHIAAPLLYVAASVTIGILLFWLGKTIVA